MVSILASRPSCPGSIPSIPKILSDGKIDNIAEVHQQHWLEESGMKDLIEPF